MSRAITPPQRGVASAAPAAPAVDCAWEPGCVNSEKPTQQPATTNSEANTLAERRGRTALSMGRSMMA